MQPLKTRFLQLGLIFSSLSLMPNIQPVANFTQAEIYILGTAMSLEWVAELKARAIISNFFFNNSYSSFNRNLSDNLLIKNAAPEALDLMASTNTFFGEMCLINNLITPIVKHDKMINNQILMQALTDNPQVIRNCLS